MERYIHKHGCGGGIVVLQRVARCVCVCFFSSPDIFHGLIKRLGTWTSFTSILAFFLYLKASRPQKFSVCCLWYAMRDLFTCVIIRAKNNINSGKTICYIILYPGPERRVLCNGLRERCKI